MKTTAIICELNPLHNGHKRIIDYAKTFSDQVICIMSGNFTQRGLPAIADKYSRAKHAIIAGADLVVELPTVFATSSAENFALGGVRIAHKLNVDYLLFGSECNDIEKLQNCVELLNTTETNSKIREAMQSGVSYPRAVSEATNTDVLNAPNNVLAIEYLKALKRLNSAIIPVTLLREDNYNSPTPHEYASSGALRSNASLRDKYTFDYVIKDLNDDIENKFYNYAPIALSTITKEVFIQIEGVSEGIENRIISANKNCDYNTFLEQIKTKRFTRAKLQRIILSSILNITKNNMELAKTANITAYPLAVSEKKVNLLQMTDKVVDVITQKADNLYRALGGQIPPQKLIKV